MTLPAPKQNRNRKKDAPQIRNDGRAEQTADDVCANNKKRAADVEVATDPVSPSLSLCPLECV